MFFFQVLRAWPKPTLLFLIFFMNDPYNCNLALTQT